ncbi:MAG: hypothetical protein KDI79_13245 [Anaerolineae bacterium]|nr:hypothetical protein [Anaerolineae bacterium]
MDKIRPEIRTFILGTVGLSTATWNIAFDLGAYRTIFYGRILTAWVTVTAILLVVLLVPERDVPVPRWGKLFMLMPTLSMILLPISTYFSESEFIDGLVISLSVFALLVCLPYSIFVVANVVNADLLNLPETRLKVYLVIIVIVFGLIGYWAGVNNHFFFSCGDFEIAGQARPENCQPGPPMQF